MVDIEKDGLIFDLEIGVDYLEVYVGVGFFIFDMVDYYGSVEILFGWLFVWY